MSMVENEAGWLIFYTLAFKGCNAPAPLANLTCRGSWLLLRACKGASYRAPFPPLFSKGQSLPFPGLPPFLNPARIIVSFSI